MRKIIVISMVSLDGVMQAPGGPEEDPAEDFKYGGWTAPYGDETPDESFAKQMAPADLLLGRKTFDIFESYWPQHAEMWPGVNEVMKYVVSTTRNSSDWENTMFLSGVEDIRKLRESDGSPLKVWGSSKLIQTLLKNDFVDELWLDIYPVTLGNGKKVFQDGTIPAAFTLLESTVSPKGVIMAHYIRAGDVQTGTVGE
jgi:dihydrofolate reductase